MTEPATNSNMNELRVFEHGPSFLRWAGSKRKSLAILEASYADEPRKYVEPFAGSASLFFRLAPKEAELADLNGHLINALRKVRDSPSEIYKRLEKFGRDENTYYEVRKRFNASLYSREDAAAAFIYLNRNCFNGLWRTNLSGEFNVPYGGREMGRYPTKEFFTRSSAALSRARLKHQDFRKTLDRVDGKSFIYVDPPYFTASERVFVEYGRKSFGIKDLDDLVQLLREAANRGARIAFTYHGGVAIKGIPKSWNQCTFSVTRNVGGFAGARKKHAEVLYTNFTFKDISKWQHSCS